MPLAGVLCIFAETYSLLSAMLTQLHLSEFISTHCGEKSPRSAQKRLLTKAFSTFVSETARLWVE
jgi:hypothetical protein